MVTELLLPLALAFIMFSLGLGLTLDDFLRVFRRPRAIAVGLLGQMVLLPLLGLMIASLFQLSPEMAAGLMLLAACPGGASAGLVTRLAKGETALSISLTAITSLLAVISVPLVVDGSLRHFTGAGVEVSLPVLDVVKGVFIITTVPVVIGMSLRRAWPDLTQCWEVSASRLATLLFISMVMATFVGQRQLLMEHLGSIGPAALTLCLATMTLGYGLAILARLEQGSRVAIAIECGLQNAALSIFLSVSVLKAPSMAVPGVVYALLMNLCAIVFVVLMRQRKQNTFSLA